MQSVLSCKTKWGCNWQCTSCGLVIEIHNVCKQDRNLNYHHRTQSGHSHHCWQCGKQGGKEAYPTTEELRTETNSRQEASTNTSPCNKPLETTPLQDGCDTGGRTWNSMHFMTSVSWLSCDVIFHAFLALAPRPSTAPVFNCLQYAKEREKAWGILSCDPRHGWHHRF